MSDENKVERAQNERTNCRSVNWVFRDDEWSQVSDYSVGQVRRRNPLGGYAARWKLRVGSLEACGSAGMVIFYAKNPLRFGGQKHIVLDMKTAIEAAQEQVDKAYLANCRAKIQYENSGLEDRESSRQWWIKKENEFLQAQFNLSRMID